MGPGFDRVKGGRIGRVERGIKESKFDFKAELDRESALRMKSVKNGAKEAARARWEEWIGS